MKQLVVLSVCEHSPYQTLRVPKHVITTSASSLLLEHFQVFYLYANVTLKLLLFNILEYFLERYGLGLFDIIETLWFAILIVACVLVTLYNKLIVSSHDTWDKIAYYVFEELILCPALLPKLSYIIA
mgnify:CR=1 FL=1